MRRFGSYLGKNQKQDQRFQRVQCRVGDQLVSLVPGIPQGTDIMWWASTMGKAWDSQIDRQSEELEALARRFARGPAQQPACLPACLPKCYGSGNQIWSLFYVPRNMCGMTLSGSSSFPRAL
jgi:hypothetical protein